jgi:hypothetical protein
LNLKREIYLRINISKIRHKKIKEFQDLVHSFVWFCAEVSCSTLSQDIVDHVHMCMELGKVPRFCFLVNPGVFLEEQLGVL